MYLKILSAQGRPLYRSLPVLRKQYDQCVCLSGHALAGQMPKHTQQPPLCGLNGAYLKPWAVLDLTRQALQPGLLSLTRPVLIDGLGDLWPPILEVFRPPGQLAAFTTLQPVYYTHITHHPRQEQGNDTLDWERAKLGFSSKLIYIFCAFTIALPWAIKNVTWHWIPGLECYNDNNCKYNK